MVIKVGTYVLCHLISSGQVSTESQEKKIEKIPGFVKEIQEDFEMEMISEDYAVKKKKFILLVEPKEKDKIFKIGADACRPILTEEEHLSLVKSKLKQKAKKEESKKQIQDSENTSQQSEEVVKEEKVDINNLSNEQKDLLKELEK